MADSLQPPFGSREERIAYREDWARRLNQSHADWALRHDSTADFRCECWQEDCTAQISLTVEDWTVVRAKPCRFAVAPHHVAKGFEAVLKTFPNFWLIQKFGEAGAIAEQLARSDGPFARAV
jgi:hypothetical protein